jgi:hypothetical protein
MTFQEAMTHYLNGKTIRRNDWSGSVYINNTITPNNRGVLSIRDVIAVDWIVEDQKKDVYQWAFRKAGDTHWKTSKYLLTQEQADNTLKQSYEVMQVAGPFEVSV